MIRFDLLLVAQTRIPFHFVAPIEATRFSFREARGEGKGGESPKFRYTGTPFQASQGVSAPYRYLLVSNFMIKAKHIPGVVLHLRA